MSVHPSLRGNSGKSQDRTVLSRLEKLKKLKSEGKWEEGKTVFGLPKVKTVRLKIKKEKVEKAEAVAAGTEGAAAAPGAAAPAQGAPATAKKPAEATKEKPEKGK